MRTMTLTMQFTDGSAAVAVHRTDFPGSESAPEWSGNTGVLPAALLAQARTQDGLAARCHAVALELGATVAVEIEGQYLFAD